MLFLAIVGVTVGFLVLLLLLDVRLFAIDLETLALSFSREGLVHGSQSLPEVLAAVLGLSLTVVAIVVQLASQRYAARLIDLFMADPINLGAFSFMVGSCIYALLLPTLTATSDAPRLAAGAAYVLAVLNFGLLLPYFGYVFSFLQPENIIRRIRTSALKSMAPFVEGTALGTPTARSKSELGRAQTEVLHATEQISDNCLAAVGQLDRSFALLGLRSLEQLSCHCLRKKAQLPGEWKSVDARFFPSLSTEFHEEIVSQGTWVEARTLIEFERLYRRGLVEMYEVVSQIAASTRQIGMAALKSSDRHALTLVSRLFNTYIRHALNAGSIRAVYHTLYQYRQLSVAMMGEYRELFVSVVERLVEYGRLANSMGLPFATVTVAHDIRYLCEEAYQDEGTDVRPLVRLFLTLDQRADSKKARVAETGVRKAQSILGAFFLRSEEMELVEWIRDDMREESSDRLASIRDEILAVKDPKFWEITDRGTNFDYIEEDMRPFLRAFYEPLL